MIHWYAVYTKPGQEGLAEGHLRRQGFETYLPRLATRRRHARKVTAVTVPMFPRYIFVRVDIETMPWRSINGTVGVSHLVSFGERPAKIADPVIAEIRAREDEDGLVRLPAAERFRPGEKVEIADGPMREIGGLFTAATEKERVVVLMSLLGRQVPVRVDAEKLRRAS